MSNLAIDGTHYEYLSPLHEAAVEYAKMGTLIFPLKPKSKLPAVKWGTEATKDIDVINRWWTENPNYNIGIVTGKKSGIAVVDFDTEDAWEYGQREGLLLETPIVKTGRGYHVYYFYQDGVRNFQKRSDMPGIDLRAEGGYVVAPPSIHESGKTYEWIEGKRLGEVYLEYLPSWILAKPSEQKPVVELLNGVAEGKRNNALTRIEGAIIGKGYTYDEAVLNAEIWNQKNVELLEMDEIKKTVESVYKAEHGTIPRQADSWEGPILFTDIDTPELHANLLPSWLGEYAYAVSQFTQTPEALAVMIGLSVIATCTQKRFEVCPYGDDYRETMSLWTLTVLPPSERKTPVMQSMMQPIVEWEVEQKERLAHTIKEIQMNRAIAQKRIEKLKQNAATTQDEAERKKMVSEMMTLEENMLEEVHPPKLWTSDTTTEKLQELLGEQGERLSVMTDEGGIFEVMAGLYNDGKVNIDVYLNGYSGSPVRVDRKSRESIDLLRPAVTFGMAVQPMVIQEFASKRKKAFRGKGALARFLYCMPKTKVGTRDISKRSPIPEGVKDRYIDGIRRLLAIEQELDLNKKEVPKLLSLSSDALDCWVKFSQSVESMLGPEKELSAFSDWGGKLAGNCLRIAGLMHLVEQGPRDLTIGKDTLERAVKICSLMIKHAKVAFGEIGTDEVLNGAKKIFKWIERNEFKEFSRDECHRSLHGTFELTEQLEKPLKVLEDRHIIRRQRIMTTGRPKEQYLINPYFREAAA